MCIVSMYIYIYIYNVLYSIQRIIDIYIAVGGWGGTGCRHRGVQINWILELGKGAKPKMEPAFI